MKKTSLKNATLTMRQAFDELVHPSPTKAEQKEALTFFNNSCAYCGKQLTEPHWDHIIPASEGGLNQIQNRVPSCKKCNLEKRNRPWMKFVGEKNKSMKTAIDKWIENCGHQRQPNNGDIASLRDELTGHIKSFEEFYKRARNNISNRRSQT